ncbi:putative RDD family membrane protein YckC [Leeuwenhoekiella aestuarii]|uniref:Putative RDD family membrane protein YckC n=1 Tax=Leeuwenhoekiella aestuarii TaxID=2249426 RepID=A0A4Q0NXM0_9FLAO|nr:RDD family protein [Leeuwenhoekiella aestuarii]RXG16050.1 putative RDD family membrane protein YckC [Leeuwenhoekiella aestuarii]RXG16744.1 putative RDD family membrane protein YckC [Leeuwenhoekiella aestuarii]
MSKQKPYLSKLKKCSDKELVRIVTVEVHKYEPEAVQAAEDELSRRKISKLQMANLVKSVAQDNDAVKEIQNYVSSSGMRFTNFLIDFVIFVLLVLIASLALDSVFVTTNNNLLQAIGYGMILLIFLAYYGLSEYFFQKTAGKYITKTIVVTESGNKPDGKTILIRTLCRLIPFDRLSYLIVKRGLHDRFSKTRVIKDRE